MDLDKSGFVEFDEFLPWWRRRGISRVFERYDADASNSIDAHELANVMVELGITLDEVQVAQALTQLDTDGSGSVSFEEYMRWFELYDLQNEFERYDSDRSVRRSDHPNPRALLAAAI